MTGEVTIRETQESDWPILFENQRDPASSAMAGVPRATGMPTLRSNRRFAPTKRTSRGPSSTMGRLWAMS